jgi:glutathione S-transferase
VSTLILYGAAFSTYVRTARMACVEKGVGYTLAHDSTREVRSKEHLALHPFGKMPAMRHGDLVLYETPAICRYIDAAFDGPPLQPTAPAAIGRMEQWTSVITSYVYDDLIRRCVLQYIFPQGPEGEPDRRAIDAASGDLERDLRVLDNAYGGSDYLVGDDGPTIPDLMLAPILAYFVKTPEGEALMGRHANVKRGLQMMRQRRSFRETEPPPPPGA